jgi:hypothetical protein
MKEDDFEVETKTNHAEIRFEQWSDKPRPTIQERFENEHQIR